ncbi:MAG: AAA family ATPase [Melioribacteraceae bacterium]|nr:AAA family ATPase [Melioribacteraceae bacterium]
MNNKILVLIGPSGAGKSEVVKRLVSMRIINLNPTWTDRPVRPDETEPYDHVFVSSEEFKRAEEEGRFLEVVQVFGLKYKYGLTSINTHSSAVQLVMLRSFLVDMFSNYYQDFKVYQIEADKKTLKKRMKGRADNLGSRLSDVDAETELGRETADRVFINSGDISICFENIIKALEEDFNLPQQ